MKLFQEDILDIQRRTHKEYDVCYSNNAESEYVKIYNDDIIEEIISDLLDYIDEKEREISKLEEKIDDIETDKEENWKPIPQAIQYRV